MQWVEECCCSLVSQIVTIEGLEMHQYFHYFCFQQFPTTSNLFSTDHYGSPLTSLSQDTSFHNCHAPYHLHFHELFQIHLSRFPRNVNFISDDFPYHMHNGIRSNKARYLLRIQILRSSPLQSSIPFVFHCFSATLSCLYLWNHKSNFDGVFGKKLLLRYISQYETHIWGWPTNALLWLSHHILGLATQEHGSRLMLINVDSCNPDCIYTVNRRSTFASMLPVVFKDATLMRCDFYRTLTSGAIRMHPFLLHPCTYALIVVFKFCSTHGAIYAV